MQEELILDREAFGGDADESANQTSAAKPRRGLRAWWKSLNSDWHERIIGVIFFGVGLPLFLGTIYGSHAAHEYNKRVQAVERARMMDGDVFTIKGVTYNWIGDTRLFLQNERGEDAGWVMIHSENPLTKDVNPLWLYFSDKRYEPLPFPMKVRAHYRPQAWVEDFLGEKRTHENFTGSFLEFEKIN